MSANFYWTRIVYLTLLVCCGCLLALGRAHANDNPVAREQVGNEPPNKQEIQIKQAIGELLAKQVKAWNSGDLEEFMETYWKSEKLTFSSGGKTTYGWKGTLENYQKSYAPPNEMGKLNFDHLEITLLESNSALVLGQWHLRMSDEQKKDGNFSLVLRRLNSGWKIIHDHSSILDPEKSDPSTETGK